MELSPPYERYLQKELEELKRSYHKLLIICNGNSSALSDSMAALGIPTINLNLELSKALLKVPSNRRSLRVGEIVAEIIKECCHFPHYLTAVFSDYLTGKASDAFPDFVGLNHKFIL